MLELNGKVHLTKSEFSSLQSQAAANGYAINKIDTPDEYEDAVAAATLNSPLLNDLLLFLETGKSELSNPDHEFWSRLPKPTP